MTTKNGVILPQSGEDQASRNGFLVKLSRIKVYLAVLCFSAAYVIRKLGFVSTNIHKKIEKEEESGMFSLVWKMCSQWFRGPETENNNTFTLQRSLHCVAEIIFLPLDIAFDYLHLAGNKVFYIITNSPTYLHNLGESPILSSFQWFTEKLNMEIFILEYDINMSLLVILTLSTILVVISAYYFCNRTKNQHHFEQTTQSNSSDLSILSVSELNISSDSHVELEPSDWPMARLWRSLLWTTTLCCALVSIPWEFVRVYQEEVAKRATVSIQGMPADCMPSTMTAWQSLRSLMKWMLSWRHDECERYHQMVLVDPLWEVTPLMVVVSALTRCLTRPAELLSASLGRCFALLFTHVPALWQPVVMAMLALLLLLLGIMTCGYRVSVPLCFRLEPADQTGGHEAAGRGAGGEVYTGRRTLKRAR